MIVSNSTSLIYLAKLNKLNLLKKLFKKVLIPKAVYDEVVLVGKKKNYVDAKLVENAINDGWIVVKQTKILEFLSNVGIDKGELESISLAKNLKMNILLDQTHARYASELVDLKPRGTIFVLLLALSKKYISYDEYLNSLEQLINHGFRMSEEVYLEAVKMGKELSGKKVE